MWKSSQVGQAAAHLPHAQHTRAVWLAEPGQASQQCWSWAGSGVKGAGVGERQSMAGQGLCSSLAVEQREWALSRHVLLLLDTTV